MKILTKKVVVLLALLSSVTAFGQRTIIGDPGDDCLVCGTPTVTISGSTNVNLNSAYSYSVTASGGLHSATSYTVSGGVITAQSRNSVSVRWTSTGSRWVRATATVSGSLVSSTKYVTVSSPLTGGSVSSSTATSICNGGNPGTINNSSSPSGGSGSYGYQWQILSSGGGGGGGLELDPIEGGGGGLSGTWTNISGASGSSYNPPSLYSNTSYRRRVTSGGQTAYSNIVTYSIVTVSAGSISYSGGNINVGSTPSKINGTNASGSGVAYQWQRKVGTASSFSNISGATSRDYQPGSQTQTTQYRRRVVSCGQTKYSNTITIRVNLKAGAIAASSTTSPCYNGNPSTINNSTAPTGGNGSYAYQWQHRIYSGSSYGSWTNISGATSSTYNPPALTAHRKYRRRVISDGQTKYTSEITYSVRPNLNQGSISYSGSRTLNPGGNPSNIAGTNASGGNSSYAYQWQKKTTGGYSNISGATGRDYNPGALSVNTTFRRRVISCSQTKYTNEIAFTINLTGGTIAASTSTSICNGGNPSTINNTASAAGGVGGYAYQWQQLHSGGLLEQGEGGLEPIEGGGGGLTWTNVSGATGSTYNPPSLNAHTSYRRRVISGGVTAYSNIISYNIVTVTAGSISYSGGNINVGATPAKITGTNANGSGIAYQWQQKVGTASSFTDISGATSRDYQPGSQTKTTQYRRRVVSCGQTKYSNTITIRVNLKAGAIAASSTTAPCYNGNPSTINNSTTPTGGNGSYSYQWQHRIYSGSSYGSWTNISGATSSTYNPPALTAHRKYRRRVISDGQTKYTSEITYSVKPNLSQGSISYSGSRTLNPGGNPSNISGTNASGGNSSYAYQWQKKTTGGYSNISGATGRDYNPGALSVNTTFRRRVISCNQTKYTNEIAFTINLTGGTVTASTSTNICNGGNPGTINNTTSAAGGVGGYSYQWQQLQSGGLLETGEGGLDPIEGGGGTGLTWTNVSGATSSTYNPPSLTANRVYRRRVTSGSSEAFSNSITYNIVTVSAGSISYSGGNINVGATPAQISGTNATGAGIDYQWQQKVGTASSFTDITGATNRDYQPGSQTKTTQYRRRVISCGQTVYSNIVTVRVNLTKGAILATSTTSPCYNGNPSTINNGTTPTGGNGSYAYQWQHRIYSGSSYGSWTNISGATSSSFNPPALTTHRKYRRRVKSDGQTQYSSEITYTVSPNLNQGSISYSGGRTLNPGGNPSTITGTTASGGNNSYAYQWQQKTNGGYTNIPGATNRNYDPGALSVNTTFQRQVISCGQTKYTNEIAFTINLVGGTVTATSNTSICSGTDPDVIENTASAAGAVGGYSYQWQYFLEGGGLLEQGEGGLDPIEGGGGGEPLTMEWRDIAGATSATFNPPALTVNRVYRRKVTSGSSEAYSNSIGYIIAAPVNKGSVSYSGGAINAGATPSLISGTTATGGNGISYRWQWKRGTETSFTDIPSNLGSTVTSKNYQPQALTTTTSFRRRVSSCGENHYTNAVTVEVNLTAGSIGGNQTICSGSDPSNIANSVTPTGGNGSYSYVWEKREYVPVDPSPGGGGPTLEEPLEGGGGVTDPVLPGPGTQYVWTGWTQFSAGSSHNPGPITYKTQYRRKVTSAGVTKTSNTITKDVYAPVDPSTISYPGGDINAGSTPGQITGDVASGGSSVSYQWQQKTTGGYTDITGATGQNYQPDALSTTTRFIRIATTNCGSSLPSNEVIIGVILNPGTIQSGSETICLGSDAPLINSLTPASGGSGSYQYQWQVLSSLLEGPGGGLEQQLEGPGGEEITGDNWVDIPGETNLTFDPGFLNMDMTYRRKVTSGGAEAFTAAKFYTVSSPLTAGSISYTGGNVNADGNPGNISGTPATGGISPDYQWQQKVGTATGFSNISGATNKDYNPPSGIDYTTTYRRRVKSCGATEYSNLITIEVNFSAGAISGNQTICTGGDPTNLSSNSPARGGVGGYDYQWQENVYLPTDPVLGEGPIGQTGDGGNATLEGGGNTLPSDLVLDYQWSGWRNITGAKSTSYNPGTQNYVTQYRRVVTSGGVSKNSNTITVDLEELPDPGTITYTGGTITSGTTPAQIVGSDVTSTFNFEYRWQKRVAGGFTDISSSNTRDFSPGPLSLSTTYQRIIENDCGEIEVSNTVKIPVLLVAGSSTTSNHDICFECSKPTLSPASPTGGNGQYSYQWQILGSVLIEQGGEPSGGGQSIEPLEGSGGGNDEILPPPGSEYEDIPLADDATYTPTNMLWVGTRTFRRKVVSDGQVSYSAPINVTVYPVIQPGTISYNTEACQGEDLGTISGTLPTGGNNTYEYRWQYYTGSSWSTFNTSNSQSYDPSYNLAADTRFRRQVRSVGSNWKNSNELLIETYDIISGNDLGSLSATTERLCPNSKTEFTYTPGTDVNTNNTRLYGEKDGNTINFGKISNTKSIHVKPGYSYYVQYSQPCTTVKHTTVSISFDFYENCNIPPSLNQNFVRTEVPRVPVRLEYDLTILDATEKSTSYAYSDGLGRPTITIDAEAGKNFEDFIQFNKYGDEGRQDTTYMAYYYKASIPGKFISTEDAINQQEDFYNSSTSNYADISHDSKPYLTTEWDERGRVKAMMASGEVRHNGDIKTTYEYAAIYDPSLAGEDPSSMHAPVIKWEIIGGLPRHYRDDQNVVQKYLAKELSVVSVTNVEGRKSRTITDARGLTITRQIYDEDQEMWVGPYNVYDNYGRVRFIVPPLLQSIETPTSDDVKELAFEYKYDGKGRVIKERAPGSGWISYVFDQWNRIVLKRHEAQFVKIGDGPFPTEEGYKTWTFFKYDALNRQIMSGEIYEERERQEMQNLLNQNLVGDQRYETTHTSSSRGYTKYKSFPDLNTDYSIYEIHSVNYFDNYDFVGIPGWDAEGHDFGLNTRPGFGNFGWAPEGYVLVTEDLVIQDHRLVVEGGTPPEGDVEHNGKYAKRPGVTITFEEGVVPGPGYEEIDATEPHANAVNLATGSKVKILGTNKWLNTVVYYDERGRVIQSIAENHIGGIDRVTNELDWSGEVQKTLIEHESKDESGVLVDQVTVLNEYEYSHNEQLIKAYQTINEDPKVLIAEYHYNILGELIEKNLHSENDGTSFLQSIDYRYNLQGLMTHLNDVDLSDGENDVFGMEYYYETSVSINNESTQPRFDGMVNAIAWNADNVIGGESNFTKTAIGYSYDRQSRLRSTDYGVGTSFNDDANANAYTVQIGELGADGKYTGGYDNNGNILSLDRISEKNPMDQLTYNYALNSNKLDGVEDDATKDGFNDFNAPTDIKTLGSGEYTYDRMGNMIFDSHKEIKLHYNHLQLVDRIDFVDDEETLTTIVYTYDAARNRLSKEVVDADNNSIAKVDYVGNIEYLNDKINQVFTAEGRAYQQNNEYHHEYFILDHQQNNRVAFGHLPERKIFTATMELKHEDYEETHFKFPNDDIRSEAENHTPLGKGSVALNGTLVGRQIGPAKVLTISSGDEVEIEVWAKYETEFANSTAVGGIVTAVASAFDGAIIGTGLENDANTINTALALPSDKLFSNDNSTDKDTRAYLQYIFFDANYDFKEAGTNYKEVTSSSLGKFAKYESGTLTFSEPGYLFVYLVNETNENQYVFFDDLKIMHSSESESFKVSQVNDYYPFGLPTSNSWRAEGYIDPGMLYQSSYASYDSLTGFYDFLSRSYDPTLGRFFAIDPAGQFSSPYLGMGNAPHMGVDPNGESWFGDFLINLGAQFAWNTAANAGQAWVTSLNGHGSFSDNFQAQGFTVNTTYNTGAGFPLNSSNGYGGVTSSQGGGSPVFPGLNLPDWVVGDAWDDIEYGWFIPGIPNPNTEVGGYLDYGHEPVPDLRQAFLALRSGTNPCPSCPDATMSAATASSLTYDGLKWAGGKFVDAASESIIQQGIANNAAAGIDAPVKGIKVPKVVKVGGHLVGGAFALWEYNLIEDQYANGEINKKWYYAEHIANGAGTIPIVGTGVTIGWELGRWITQRRWYQRFFHGRYYPPTIDDCITCSRYD